MRALIIANGDPTEAAWTHRIAQEHDLIVATDGAAHRLIEIGLRPHIVCGDFDSVELEAAQSALPQTRFLATPDPDRADLEKALHIARVQGAAALTLIGATGGRMDHTLGNIALLLRYHLEFPVQILEPRSALWAISGAENAPGKQVFPATIGDTISLISLDGRARVSISGVQWELEDYPLPIGTMGVSNVAVAETVQIEARGGVILVCHLFTACQESR